MCVGVARFGLVWFGVRWFFALFCLVLFVLFGLDCLLFFFLAYFCVCTCVLAPRVHVACPGLFVVIVDPDLHLCRSSNSRAHRS